MMPPPSFPTRGRAYDLEDDDASPFPPTRGRAYDLEDDVSVERDVGEGHGDEGDDGVAEGDHVAWERRQH